MIRRFILATVLAACSAAGVAAVIRTSTYTWDSIWGDGKTEIVDYAISGDSLGATDCRITLKLRGDDRQANGGEFEMAVLRTRRGTPVEKMSIWLDRRLSLCDGMTWSDGKGSRMLTWGRQGHTRLSGETLEVAAPHLQNSRSRTQTVYYDALPVWLRGQELEAPDRDSVGIVALRPSRTDADVAPVPAEIEIVGPAGPPSETSHGGLQVNVRYGDKVDRLWFYPGPGHVMLAWERSDGTTLTFKKSERRVLE